MRHLHTLASVAMLTVGLALTACGGGGGGGGSDQAGDPVLGADSLIGSWSVAGSSGGTSTNFEMTTLSGSAQINNAVFPWTTVLEENDNGELEAPETENTTIAEVATDGSMIIRSTVLDPSLQVQGQLAADASVAMVGSTLARSIPSLQVMTRRSRGQSLAAIEGDNAWIAFGVQHDALTNQVFGYSGIATINSQGTFIDSYRVSNGIGSRAGLSFRHGISEDGSNALGSDMRGGFRPAADFGSFSGRMVPNLAALQDHVLLVKLSSGVTDATANGRYRIMLFAPGANTSFFLSGIATFDGAGSVNIVFDVVNEEGTLGDSFLESGQYSLADDGRGAMRIGELLFDVASTQTGDVIAISGASATTKLPAIGLLLRIP